MLSLFELAAWSVAGVCTPYALVATHELPGSTPGAREELQVSVAVRIIDATELQERAWPSIDLRTLARPEYPQQPVTIRGQFLGVDHKSLSIDLNAVESVEVLRGAAGTLFGNDVLSGIVNQVTKTLDEEVLQARTFNPMNGIRAGGWSDWSLKGSYKDIFASTKIDRVTIEGHMETGRHQVYFGDIKYGTALLPSTPVIKFEPDGDVWGGAGLNYLDRVGGVRFTPEYEKKLGIPGLPIAPYGTVGNFRTPIVSGPAPYYLAMRDGLGGSLIDGLISKSGLEAPVMNELMLGVAARGNNMNTLQFPGSPDIGNDVKCGSEMLFPPGTYWMPDRAGYQGMTNIVQLRHSFGPGLLSVDSAVISELRTHCLNMGLKEPADGVRYFPYAPSDMVLSKLAEIAGASRFRGPWDQARTWIYTDRASFADVNKRLLPPITEGRYVNGLFDVASLGGLTEDDYKSKALFDPALLMAATASDIAFDWFCSHIARRFENEVAAWLGRSKASLSKLAGDDEYDQKHLSRLLRGLISAHSAKVRLAALEFLVGLGSNRAFLKDKIGDLRTAMYSSVAAEVSAALEVCSKYVTRRSFFALKYLAEHGTTPAIKSKAAALLAEG